MKILYNKIDKKVIQELPRVLFEGRIFVIQTEAEANKAVSYLKGFPVLGVDTETRPAFRKGQVNKVALLQVSTDDTCFLFRLNRIGLPDSVVSLFQDKDTVKVGLSLRDDIASLHKRGDFEPQSFVELQTYVRDFGIEDMEEVTGLNALYGAYINLQYSLPGGQKIKFWDDDRIYLGNQICKKNSNRCYGLTADENYLLVCEYGDNGSDAEIIVYKKRR